MKTFDLSDTKERHRQDLSILINLTHDLTNVITSSKLEYYKRIVPELNDPKTAPRAYSAIYNKVSRKVNALWRIANYMPLEKRIL